MSLEIALTAHPTGFGSTGDTVIVSPSAIVVRWRHFMLSDPRPADLDIEGRLDIEAARNALAESSERIPYEQIRKELGLE